MLTFDRFMEEIELEKYLKSIPKHYTGRLRYNPVSMLKTVLFGFMTNGYISLRELEDQCKVNLRFMYLMEHETPSYRTFGYFINEVIGDSIEEISVVAIPHAENLGVGLPDRRFFCDNKLQLDYLLT